MANPLFAHLKVVKSIIMYIKGTLHYGLFFPRNDKLKLIGFSNVDLGGDLDERKSMGAFIFCIGTTSVHWATKKQFCISLSSTKSEYKALVKATKEALWIKALLNKLDFRTDVNY